jgi:lysophospholipase L1-like esterase
MRTSLALSVAAVLAGPVAAAPDPVPGLLLVGDSTLAPSTGFGDALCQRMEQPALCLNLARGGRSTLSYRAEGLWQRVLARLQAGPAGVQQHVLIQFGHNDQPGKPGRSTDLATEFPANLRHFVREVRAAGGVPVLATPLTRRSFRNGELVADLEPWAAATRKLAADEGVPLVDLYAASAAAVQQMGQAEADTLAMAPPPAPGQQAPAGGSGFDRTHVGAKGACVFADLMARVLVQAVPAFHGTLRPGTGCAGPWPATSDVLPPLPALNAYTYDDAGWAVGTLGGRGGRIERVTTLAASGPGSLHAALQAPGARTIVFEVGGVIDLGGSSLQLREPFVTIAGQTAPAPGITLIKGGLNIGTHDVIVQHLMVRPGAYGSAMRSGGDHDAISTVGGAHHVIVDHCSLSWGTDENLSASGPRFNGASVAEWRRNTSHDITYSHNLVFEGLGDSVHPKGEHSKGTLVHDNATGVLLLANVYAANRERNALFKGGVHAAMVNNLIVNPGPRAVHYNLVGHEWAGHAFETGQIALVGNVLRHGSDTPPGTPLFSLGGQGDVELHLHDNIALDVQGKPVDLTGRSTSSSARILPATTPYLPPRLRVLPPAGLEHSLLRAAGARPWDRHPIDSKLLSDMAEGRTRLIDSETESSGFPRHAPTARSFDPGQWNLADMSPRAGWAQLLMGRRRD